MLIRDNLNHNEFDTHKRNEIQIPRRWREYVLDRDNRMCRRCCSVEHLELHHIILRSHGRDHHPDNLIVLCGKCHRRYHDGLIGIFVDSNGDIFFSGSRLDLYRDLRSK